ncbi:MAG: type VI secretion system protein TssA [Aquisalimonadaceae bacterium]
MDLHALLEPQGQSSPTGTDLDATGEIVSLDMLARWGTTEHEPDWPALQDACLEALGKSRDLRPAAYLAAALLQTEGVRGLADGLHLIRGLLETWWDELYPPLDEDGDAMERSSALFNLTNFHRVLKPLRTAPLVEARAAGRFSLLDIEIAEGKADVPDGYEGDPPQAGLVTAAFQATDGADLRELAAAVAQAVENIAAIEGVFSAHCGVEQAPDLSRLKEGLQRIALALRTYMPEDVMPDADNETPDAPATTPADAVPAPPAVAGEIRSRQDAVAAMDRIARYFRSHEPSSPVPLLMERATRLVDMDFLSILKDVAPDAVAQVQKLRGHDAAE